MTRQNSLGNNFFFGGGRTSGVIGEYMTVNNFRREQTTKENNVFWHLVNILDIFLDANRPYHYYC